MRILIADDERSVCDLLTELVRACGHEVVGQITTGGLEVIRAFARTKPDLTLLDVLMPHCNGLTVFHALLSRRPDAQVVLMSGADHPFVGHCQPAGFLRKPMRLEDLQRVLESIEAPNAAAPAAGP